MSWWAILPPLLAGLVLILLPGLIVGYSASLRGITAWGLAPALSLSAYAVLSVVYGLPHLRWNLLTVTGGMVVLLAVVVLVIRLLLRRFRPLPPARDGWSVNGVALAGVLIAAVLVSVRFAVAFGRPDDISQTFDNNFHLNGVRYILDTGDASPFTFSNLAWAFHGPGAFYPNLWHGLAALIVQFSGATIPVAVNAFSMVIGGCIWTLGCVFLVRMLAGARPVALLAAGIMSASFAAFPLMLVTFGVLYPNLLGISVVPAGLGALVLACGLAKDPQLRPAMAWIAFVLVLPGIALAHPNAFVSLLLLGVPVLCAGGWRWLRRRRAAHARPRVYVAAAIVAIAVFVVLYAVYRYVRPPQAAATWGPFATVGRALFLSLLNAEFHGVPAVIVTALALIGIIATLVQRQGRWLIVSTLFVVVLYVLMATLPIGYWRYRLTGIWYSDVNRIIALFPVVLVPLATLGLIALGGLLARFLARNDDGARRRGIARSIAVTTGLVAVVLGVLIQAGPSLTAETHKAQIAYRVSDRSALLSGDERRVIDSLPALIPADAVIAGDPWTGTSMAWALANRRVLTPHIYSVQTPATALILHSLRTAKPGSAVCAAVHEEHVGYALDFGTDGVFGSTDQYPGVHHLASSRSVTLVERIGRAALYRITGCG
jgi:hypothetical protein